MNGMNVIGKGRIHKCRYQVSLAGDQASIKINGHGLKALTAGYTLKHKMAKDGQLDRRDAGEIADLMLALIKRIEGLARMITAWGINAETGVSRLTPATQRQLRKPQAASANNKNRNPLARIKV